MTEFHLHLVSDATGETLHGVARACLVQFEDTTPIEHVWSLIRSRPQLEKVMAAIEANPGVVMFTLVDRQLREQLMEFCHSRTIVCVPVLDHVLAALSTYLGIQGRDEPGRQHALDEAYYGRIGAMDYALSHDDGMATQDLDGADVVLVGVSRTSKTPTAMYLANRGLRTANVPLVINTEPPPELLRATRPLIVGLTNDPERLMQVRRNRLRSLHENETTAYADLEAIHEEVAFARKLFARHHWPVIDVTRRSVEETAAAIIKLYDRRAGRIT